MKCDVIIVGVGGQGILVTSNVISQAALDSGLEVKKSETHGMAQRGGSVVTHVRIGERVDGVLIPKGEADVLIASEPVEGLRYMEFLKKDGKAVVNSEAIKVPGYPIMEALRDELSKQGAIIIDATDLAVKAGHPLTQSIVLVGAASRYLPIKEEALKEAIKKVVGKKIEENLKAFDLGSRAV